MNIWVVLETDLKKEDVASQTQICESKCVFFHISYDYLYIYNNIIMKNVINDKNSKVIKRNLIFKIIFNIRW